MDRPTELALIELRIMDRPISSRSLGHAFGCLERIWFRYTAQDRLMPPDEARCELMVANISGGVSTQLSLRSAEYPVRRFAEVLDQAFAYFVGDAQIPGCLTTVDVQDLRDFLCVAELAQGFTLQAGFLNRWDRHGRPRIRYPCPLHSRFTADGASLARHGADHWLARPVIRIAS